MLRSNETLLGQNPPQSQYLEAYRRLRANLLALREEQPFKSILVTSALPNEGKTCVMLNLSTIMAQGGLRVIVVDADFAHPRLHEEWQLRESPGLTDACCTARLAVDSVIQETELPLLKAVPAGDATEAGPDLASGTVMAEVLQELGQRADLVIVDSAPVLGYAGTLQLARMVDCVLLVARARGSVGPVRRALKLLKDIGRDVRGIIVNDILEQDEAHPYYYATSSKPY